jgi:3-oxoacyl-[acyl-carrier protein] reductase
MGLIFITGSGRRIGKGLALEFAGNGWDVIIHYNSSEKTAFETRDMIRDLGRKSIAVKADILSSKEIDNAFDLVLDNIGIPDVLVNNSGIFPDKHKLHDISDELWDDVLGINLRGAFYCSRKFSTIAKENARIVNIGSLGGLEVWKERIPYNVSKAGVIHLTKALARELAPKITVNCVCPGAILIPEEPSPTDTNLISVNRIPMERYGSVKDLYDAVNFFATCSNYITGQVISVDGGYHNAR